MRTIAIMVGASLAFMALVPLASYNASAAAESQHLWADTIISSDAEICVTSGLSQADALNMVNREATDLGDDYGFDGIYWDNNPGCVLWGNASSSTDGSFGTAEVRYELTDLIGETADYYYIDMLVGAMGKDGDITDPTQMNSCWLLAPGSESWSMRLGFGYIDADSGTAEFIDEDYQNITGAGGSYPQKEYTTMSWSDVENDVEGRPFTKSEINNLYVVLQLRFDPAMYNALLGKDEAPPVYLGVCFALLLVVPTTHTPEVPPTGGFILRPDGDTFANGFENYSVDSYEGMYGALNETNRHGDAEQSYINASWSKSAFVGLEFTDPPSWAADVEYKVTLWSIIRQTETGVGAYYTLTMSISSDGYDQKVYYPSTSYTNNTHASDFVPGSAEYWTLTDLEDILANMWLGWVGETPSGELRVTQVAFLCVPIVPGDYVPDTGDYTDDSFQAWLTTGNGMYTIFAVMGGFGLIAGAPLAIIMFKEGRKDGVGALALSVAIIFISLCFLIVGLAPYN